jgi:hypothetical protein
LQKFSTSDVDDPPERAAKAGRNVIIVRYLVTAKVKPGREGALAKAIEDGTLGAGSIAGGEYHRNMECARLVRDGLVKWVEVCYCATPLEEERPYWEEYFDLVKVQDAHVRTRCKDLNGTEYWACSDCDCTEKLESRLATWGPLFLDTL